MSVSTMRPERAARIRTPLTEPAPQASAAGPVPLSDRCRRMTVAPGALTMIVDAEPLPRTEACTPEPSSVRPLTMLRAPKAPESTAEISPSTAVAEAAAEYVRHGDGPEHGF